MRYAKPAMSNEVETTERCFFHLQRLPLCLVTIYIEFTLYTLLEIISSYLLDGSGYYSVNSS